jgi:hypothetical protein
MRDKPRPATCHIRPGRAVSARTGAPRLSSSIAADVKNSSSFFRFVFESSMDRCSSCEAPAARVAFDDAPTRRAARRPPPSRCSPATGSAPTGEVTPCAPATLGPDDVPRPQAASCNVCSTNRRSLTSLAISATQLSTKASFLARRSASVTRRAWPCDIDRASVSDRRTDFAHGPRSGSDSRVSRPGATTCPSGFDARGLPAPCS